MPKGGIGLLATGSLKMLERFQTAVQVRVVVISDKAPVHGSGNSSAPILSYRQMHIYPA
jgi:hypothetical protein